MSAAPDFVTFDGRGGATGSSPKFLKDASSVPTYTPLPGRAGSWTSAAWTVSWSSPAGCTSRDFVKALAMGADAVAVASAALIALACQRYGSATMTAAPWASPPGPGAARAAEVVETRTRVANFLNASTEELRSFARCTGHGDIHELSTEDLCTVSGDREVRRNCARLRE